MYPMNQMPQQPQGFDLNQYLQQAQQGQMGGIQQQQPMQQPQQFDPRILEALGLAQGYDAEDERIQRQMEQAAALRKQGQSPITAPKSSGMWAQAIGNLGQSAVGAILDRRARKQQGAADQHRAQGMRDFSTMYRGAETANNFPFSPMRR